MTKLSIHPDNIRPGDLVEYGGQSHRITDVLSRPGWSFPVAVDGLGWAIALGQGPFNVWRG